MAVRFRDFGSGTSLKLLATQLFKRAGRFLRGLFKSDVTEERAEFNKRVKSGDFDFLKEALAARKAIRSKSMLQKWLNEYRKEHGYKGVMLQGHLYYFLYPHPKYEETLEFFDPAPLVLCFNVQFKQTGNLVEYGINLHYLPRPLRALFLKDVFELFKLKYSGEMFSETPRPINDFSYDDLQALADKYKIGFAVRSYIPSLRQQAIQIDYQDWPTAILIETTGWRGITEKSLMQLYNRYGK